MFTQSLLCKAIKDGLLDKVIYSNKTFWGNVRYATTSLWECIPAKPWFKSYCRYVSIRSYEWQYWTVAIYKISNAKIGISASDSTAKQFFTGTWTYTWTFTGVIYTTPDVNQAINLYATWTDSGSVFWCQWYMEVWYVISRDFDETFKPQTVSWLWEVNNPISFWRLPNNKRWDWGLLDGVWGLPLEFVEKYSWNSWSNKWIAVPAYSYITYQIAVANDNIIMYWRYSGAPTVYKKNIYADFICADQWTTITTTNTNIDIDVYVYKLNLPQ